MFEINIQNLKNQKYNVFFKKTHYVFLFFYSKCGHKYENISKEEESIEILKILGLINNI